MHEKLLFNLLHGKESRGSRVVQILVLNSERKQAGNDCEESVMTRVRARLPTSEGPTMRAHLQQLSGLRCLLHGRGRLGLSKDFIKLRAIQPGAIDYDPLDLLCVCYIG